jgi:predicted transposase YdaD
MRRDSIFYKLFQQSPTLLFQLLATPPSNADAYRFDSVAVKEPRFEIDGVFLPPENQDAGVVYFCVRVACRRHSTIPNRRTTLRKSLCRVFTIFLP